MMSDFTEVLGGEVDFRRWVLETPLRLSSGPVTEITEARAAVRVRVGQVEAVGRGAVLLSHLWAWPQSPHGPAATDAAMRECCEAIAAKLAGLCGDRPAHPLELGLTLHDNVSQSAPAEMPILAQLVCASPFDAALHDAAGQALGCSAFAIYDEPTPLPSLDGFFPKGTAMSAIRDVLRRPSPTLQAWLTLGVDECDSEVLSPWIDRCGYRCFKLKLTGQDNAVDVAQTVRLHELVTSLGVAEPQIAVDSNGGNPDADSVGEYLQQLRSASPAAFASLAYLEQPTAADIMLAPQDWRAVTRLKPVVLDEGLNGLESVVEAHRQGWSGIAVKTCKGHSTALATAAWAYQHDMALVMQDLTNPGIAAIHSALLCAHLPISSGIELNSPRFLPQANAEWLPRLDDLFYPRDGLHRVPSPAPVGLGSTL